MKRFISIALTLCAFLTLFSGYSNTYSWKTEDFSFYDEEGRAVEFLTTKDSSQGLISLDDINQEKGENFQTYRGVKIGDRATTALKKYDLEGFYYAIVLANETSSKEEAEEKNISFHQSYPTFREALEHTDELPSGLNMFASMQFYKEGDTFIPYELNEYGNATKLDRGKDTYHMSIIISDSKIKDITFEIMKGDPLYSRHYVDNLPMQLPHNGDINFGDTRSTIEEHVGILVEDSPYLLYKNGFTQQDPVQIGNVSLYVTYLFNESDQLVSVGYIGDNDFLTFELLKELYTKLYGQPIENSPDEDENVEYRWRILNEENQEIDCEIYIDSESGKAVSYCRFLTFPV